MTALLAESEARHLPGAGAGAVVTTPFLREIEAHLRHLTSHKGAMVVNGAPGLGKSFTVDWVARRLGHPLLWLDMPHQPKPKEAIERIYRRLTGFSARRLREWELLEEVAELLSPTEPTSAPLLVIDEAQNLGTGPLRQLRYLHDRPETSFVLVLVGHNVIQTIKAVPELDSRVARRVLFREFKAKEIPKVMSAYHPLFAASGPDAMTVLQQFARGNFRAWARILEIADSHLRLPHAHGISEPDARSIVRVIKGLE